MSNCDAFITFGGRKFYCNDHENDHAYVDANLQMRWNDNHPDAVPPTPKPKSDEGIALSYQRALRKTTRALQAIVDELEFRQTQTELTATERQVLNMAWGTLHDREVK